jgi:hypothetical protein
VEKTMEKTKKISQKGGNFAFLSTTTGSSGTQMSHKAVSGRDGRTGQRKIVQCQRNKNLPLAHPI